MKLLAIVGSPRPQGNTELLVNQVIAGARTHGADAETVHLHWRRVQPIEYCKPCLERGACLITDEFEAIMAKFIAADYVILGTPLYWYGPSAQMKAFIDRWSCKLYMSTRLTGSQEDFRRRMRGKRIIAVSAHEEAGPYVLEHLWGMLQWSCNYLEMHLVERVHAMGNRRGEVANDTAALQHAFLVGQRLVGDPSSAMKLS